MRLSFSPYLFHLHHTWPFQRDYELREVGDAHRRAVPLINQITNHSFHHSLYSMNQKVIPGYVSQHVNIHVHRIYFLLHFLSYRPTLHWNKPHLSPQRQQLHTSTVHLLFQTLPTFILSSCAFRTQDSGTKSSFCMQMFKWLHGFSINGNATWGNSGLFQQSWLLNDIMLLKAYTITVACCILFFVSTCMCVFLFTGALNGSSANFYPLNWFFEMTG